MDDPQIEQDFFFFYPHRSSSVRINTKGILSCTIQGLISSQEPMGTTLPKLMEWLSYTPTVNLLPTQPDLILFDMNR